MQVVLEMKEFLDIKDELVKLVKHAKEKGADARWLNDTRELFLHLHIAWPKDPVLNEKVSNPVPDPAEIDAAAEARRTDHHA